MGGQRPPWREPMLWLVAGLPVASVVAGFALLIVASRSGSSDVGGCISFGNVCYRYL